MEGSRENGKHVTENVAEAAAGNILPLAIAEGILLLIALVILPLYAAWKAQARQDLPLKGLALPQGSVRSMLALTVVGSFVVFLIFGGVSLPSGTRFTEIVAALTGVAGTIIGFYFGSGGSGTTPDQRHEPAQPKPVTPSAQSSGGQDDEDH